MSRFIEKFNQVCRSPEFGKLVLRVAFAGMFLLHGIHKIYDGTAFIQGKFAAEGLPASLAYLVYLGEVIAPVCIILGILTRFSAFLCVGTCVVVLWLMFGADLFSLAPTGALKIEGVTTFLFGFLAVMLLGAGKYALKAD